MEAPTSYGDSMNDMKPLNIESFNLIFKEKEYKLSIIRASSILQFVLSIEGKPHNFEAIYTYTELVRLSNIFGLFSNLEEILKYLKQTISSNKYQLIDIRHNQINLQLNVNVFEKIIDITIPLCQKEINQKEINDKLLEENKELRKDINFLKEENIKIKQELEELKKKMNVFQNINVANINNSNSIPNSNIALTIEQNNLIINRLKMVEKFQNTGIIQFKLLYQATRDGDDSQTFHQKCDYKKNVLVLIKTNKNRKFGGFCSIGYRSEGDNQKDNTAFIFSLDKLKIYNIKKDHTAVFWGVNYGPLFAGGTVVVSDKFFNNCSYANSKENCSYEITQNYELNGGEYDYKIEELEVYKVI